MRHRMHLAASSDGRSSKTPAGQFHHRLVGIHANERPRRVLRAKPENFFAAASSDDKNFGGPVREELEKRRFDNGEDCRADRE